MKIYYENKLAVHMKLVFGEGCWDFGEGEGWRGCTSCIKVVIEIT